MIRSSLAALFMFVSGLFVADLTLPGSWVEPLVQVGITGAVLYWFMMRAEDRLKGIEKAVDRLSRSNLLMVLANEEASQSVRKQAEQELADMGRADEGTRG